MKLPRKLKKSYKKETISQWRFDKKRIKTKHLRMRSIIDFESFKSIASTYEKYGLEITSGIKNICENNKLKKKWKKNS